MPIASPARHKDGGSVLWRKGAKPAGRQAGFVGTACLLAMTGTGTQGTFEMVMMRLV